jgi:hypothetical protein
MTNFKSALSYGLVLLGAAFLAIIFFSEAIFGDLTNTDSYKPLLVVVPVMAVVLIYLIIKTEQK